VLVLRKSGTRWWGTRTLMTQSSSKKMGPFDKLTLFPVTVSNIGHYQASDIPKLLPNIGDIEGLFRKREQMLMLRIRLWKYAVGSTLKEPIFDMKVHSVGVEMRGMHEEEKQDHKYRGMWRAVKIH